jgi:hypothetical protein
MTAAEQTDKIAWAIHDEGKQVGNVPTEHAHIEGFQFRASSELSAKDNRASIVIAQADGCRDTNRRHCPTDPC